MEGRPATAARWRRRTLSGTKEGLAKQSCVVPLRWTPRCGVLGHPDRTPLSRFPASLPRDDQRTEPTSTVPPTLHVRWRDAVVRRPACRASRPARGRRDRHELPGHGDRAGRRARGVGLRRAGAGARAASPLRRGRLGPRAHVHLRRHDAAARGRAARRPDARAEHPRRRARARRRSATSGSSRARWARPANSSSRTGR